MKFRPCIDIHNGRVKQIIGSTLRDAGDRAAENFVAEYGAAHYAAMFRESGLAGGHVILLNHRDSPFYAATREQAEAALSEWPGGMQAGGGITAENAGEFLEAGASHVIVTSYVFSDGRICLENLEKLERAAGRERVVLDLSCRRKPGDGDGGPYYIMTDRWQRYTDIALTPELMEELSSRCGEFLVHAVSAEGKAGGIDEELVRILAESPVPVTYAGGIRGIPDIEELGRLGGGRVDFTVGSALDIYGGDLPYEKLKTLRGDPGDIKP